MRRAATRGPPSLKTRVIGVRRERLQRRAEIGMAAGVEGDALDNAAEVGETQRGLLRRALARDDERRQVARRGSPAARAKRQPQMGVEDNPPRLSSMPGQPDRQSGIVGERRLHADHDRLVGRPHHLDPRVGDRTGDLETLIVRAP